MKYLPPFVDFVDLLEDQINSKQWLDRVSFLKVKTQKRKEQWTV